jgi:hypothetical protein
MFRGAPILLPLLFFSILPAACAQTTWQGLNFDMSRADVITVLSSNKLKQGEGTSLKSTVDFQLHQGAAKTLFRSSSRHTLTRMGSFS